MRGDLSETPATDVCRALAAATASGVLDIEGPDGRGAIVFQSGRVVAATSPTPRARLGDRLVNAGLLDEDALDEVLRSQARAGTHRRLGGLLVGRGLVSHDAVRLVAQEQVIDAVFDVVRWRYGGYRFDEGDLSDDTEIPLDIPVDQLLVEVARREQEWVELERVIPDLDAVPSFVSGTGSATASLEPDEFTVLASIDGVRSVSELADDLGYGQFEAARIVYGLTMLGIVEVSLPEDEVGRALEEALSALSEGALPDEPDLPPMVVPELVPDPPAPEPYEPERLLEPEPFEPEPLPEPYEPEPSPFDPEPEPLPYDPEPLPFDPEPVPVPAPGDPGPFEPVPGPGPSEPGPVEPDPETFETEAGSALDQPVEAPEEPAAEVADDEPAVLAEPEADVDPADDAEPEPWDAPPVADVVPTVPGDEDGDRDADEDAGGPARAVLEVDLPGPTDEAPTGDAPTDDDGPTSLVDVARLLADLEVGRAPADEAAADEAAAQDADVDDAGEDPAPEEPAGPEPAPGRAAPRGAEVSELLRELSRLALEDGTAAEQEPRREPPTPPSEPRRPATPPREEPPRRRRLFGRG